MFDIIQSTELWIAVFTGGFAVKLIDYLLPALLNRRKNRISLVSDEKSDLRNDIEYLRGQIEELRAEVDGLKKSLTEKEQEVSIWQRRYWKKKIELEKVIWQIKNFGDEDIRGRVISNLSSGSWDQEVISPDEEEER